MPRRPEIGTIQLYPNRPLKATDKNGYVLKFYCPLQRKRIRRNCGTRDRREARRVLRECRDRLLNGDYVASGGAITAATTSQAPAVTAATDSQAKSWEDAVEHYRRHKQQRVRGTSLLDAMSRLHVTERIFVNYRRQQGLSAGFPVQEVMTLPMLEYLQDQLLAGAECRYPRRSPNTVNSMVSAVMAFVRFCDRHGWIESVPPVEKLETDEVMKGRPVTTEEFERMLAATGQVVGEAACESWQFALRVLWESGFRVGDLMDFSWDDDRHIHPVWPSRSGDHPTIAIPATQKNRRQQEVPLLPGLQELLQAVPESQRTGWIVNPEAMEYEITARDGWFQPRDDDLKDLVVTYSNLSIAAACGVSETTVRKWLVKLKIRRDREFKRSTGCIDEADVARLRQRAKRRTGHKARREITRMTSEHVSRVISKIGKAANVVVCQEDKPNHRRVKYASAHDLRRGCAQRLINLGVSAETLKVLMRHSSFATTEKHYGATRSAQSAATEVADKLSPTDSTALVGGLMGGKETAPQLNAEELLKLKSLLNSL